MDEFPVKNCVCCGKPLPELHDWNHGVPDVEFLNPKQSNEFDGSKDVRRWRRHGKPTLYYIRGVVLIPIKGHPKESFGIGLWIEVSEKDCFEYRSTWNVPSPIDNAVWEGQIANNLAGYPETLGLPVKAFYYSKKDEPPALEICSPTHKLALDQKQGISIQSAVNFLRS